MGEWPHHLDERLPEYLAAQRWFHGTDPPAAAEVRLDAAELIWEDPGAGHALWHLLVLAGSDTYQLVIAERPSEERADFLHGREESVFGHTGGVVYYDATVDPDLARHLLEAVSGGSETASIARPLSSEQSNTSLVFDDRVIFKLFRRLRAGNNPEVEMTDALARAGFEHVAAPMVHWRDKDFDLGFGQQYLAGGADGWALAITSLRDLYNLTSQLDLTRSRELANSTLSHEGDRTDRAADRPEGAGVPAAAGGDFAAEAERLGRVTATMHLALTDVFGTGPTQESRRRWQELVAGFEPRLAAAGARAKRDLVSVASDLLDRLSRVADPGPAIRVHGDYHLAQVMRTDSGWFVLDFEGEPLRSVSERVAPTSPLKDVTSMLRSFNYASRHALLERTRTEWPDLLPLADAWESHNRSAFLDGYTADQRIHEVLPDPTATPAVMVAFELDKTLYEIDYEVAHRPEWSVIPLDALARMLDGDASAVDKPFSDD